MGMKVFRICDATFTGDDGKEVCGFYVYLIPADASGGQPERVFISEGRAAQMEYKPAQGDVVYVFRNNLGKVMDMLKV